MGKRDAAGSRYMPRYAMPHYSTAGSVRDKGDGPVWSQGVWLIAEYGASVLFAFFVLERCNLGGTAQVARWVLANPKLTVVALLSLLSVYGMLRAFFPSPLLPFGLYGALVCLIGTANYFKLFYRSEPLVPYDIFNIGPALGIAGNMGMRLNVGLVLNLALYGVLLLAAWWAGRHMQKPSPLRRVGTILLSLALGGSCLYFFADIPRLQPFGIFASRFDQYRNYQINGFTVSTLMNLADRGVRPPEGYNAETMADLRAALQKTPDLPPLGWPSTMPHIIVLQMEAYGDPARIDPRISYQIDPFAPLRPYTEEIQPFHTLVSVIGGGTSNTEYEFLTGYNNLFLPMGVTPFIRYMNGPKPSLVTDLAELGYKTVATHPNGGSFYSRQTAYPRLGFDRFVTSEEYKDPAYVGHYIADASFGEKIIELFEEERGNGPLFLYGISIQNHGPYYDREYLDVYPDFHRDYPVSVSGGLSLDEIQTIELEIYGANLRDASITLADILDYFSHVDEPVLLLVYGDHQASWSWALDLPQGPTLERSRYSTESFFWANYPMAELDRPILSASGLWPFLLRKAGLPLSLYGKGLAKQFEEIQAYSLAAAVENDGSTHYADKNRLGQYKMLQYDRMFGNRYLERLGAEE